MLIAHPNLLDPNFRRAVLFLSTNDPQEGSLGLIVNRPAGRTVADVLPAKDLGALGRVPVFLGGPVAIDQLIFASFRWHAETQRLECQHHLTIPEAQEIIRADEITLRAFIGYAGWSRGQLEGELAHRAWLVSPADSDLLNPERCPNLWREKTTSFGPWFQMVAEAPEDLSRN